MSRIVWRPKTIHSAGRLGRTCQNYRHKCPDPGRRFGQLSDVPQGFSAVQFIPDYQCQTDHQHALAVGLGVASNIFVKRIDIEQLEGQESVIGTRIAPEFGKMEFGECIKVHKPGDMSAG